MDAACIRIGLEDGPLSLLNSRCRLRTSGVWSDSLALRTVARSCPPINTSRWYCVTGPPGVRSDLCGNFCRSASRRLMFKSPMWITRLPPPPSALRDGHIGRSSVKIICLPKSVLGGNQHDHTSDTQARPHGRRLCACDCVIVMRNHPRLRHEPSPDLAGVISRHTTALPIKVFTRHGNAHNLRTGPMKPQPCSRSDATIGKT